MKLFKCVLILSLTGGINSTPLEGFGFSLVPSLGISGTTFFEPNKYPSGYTTIIRGPFNLGKVELDDGEAWGVKTDITLAPNLAFGQYSIRDQSVTPKWNFLGVGVELNIAHHQFSARIGLTISQEKFGFKVYSVLMFEFSN